MHRRNKLAAPSPLPSNVKPSRQPPPPPAGEDGAAVVRAQGRGLCYERVVCSGALLLMLGT